MTIRMLDSATPPTAGQVAQAKAAGVGGWNGYIASKAGVALEHPWTRADFATVQALNPRPIAYCSGWDDPVAVAALAKAWGVRLCLDVESGIRGDGAWVGTWLTDARCVAPCGIYGNAPVHGHAADFHVLAAYLGTESPQTWDTALCPRPATPCGWQSRGTHTEFGAGVDAGHFDDYFAGSAARPQETDMLLIRDATTGAVALVLGDNVVHVDNPTSLAALQAAGVGMANLDSAEFGLIFAAALRPTPTSGPTGTGKLSGSITIG